ncbi:MAG: DEDD exonuclease domain-containing protein [Ilumatobacteraceae bacterium]
MTATVPRPVQRSFDDLGTPLADVTFCVLDLETTGGNRAEDLITEVGAVKVRGGEFLATFQTLVNPGRAIPPQITMLTGLSDAIVAPAPRIEAVLPSLSEFLRGTILVGHNIGFDVAFLRAAFERAGHPRFDPVRVDTVALARRLVRDEVPDCRLGTLASRFRLDHRPTHRALDDALATTDLLHLLIERASGLGVLGLDDLTSLATMAGHPQAAKLKMTATLPRTPGVYMFCGHRDEVLYVGKATNLRQRVRSYFGQEDRRRIGPMLREVQSVRHHCLPDPLSAEVVEARLIARLKPRYNRAGTRVDRYCYVRLDTDSAWPRLVIVKDPGRTGLHLGPLPSRTMAGLVVDALQSALPLRRCSVRIGRQYQPQLDATPCAPAQMGVAACPCAGLVDPARYDAAVATAADTFGGRTGTVVDRLTDRMTALAGAQRYEEAALTRDRMSALEGAIRRTHQMSSLLAAGRFEVRRGDVTWVVDRARLVDVRVAGSTAGALPAAPPDAPADGRPLPRGLADEALILARKLPRPDGAPASPASG